MKGMRITPAVLRALVEDDIENAVIAATPGGIEAQEARGQREFVSNETLPIECMFCDRDMFEAMGIVYGKPIDDLFVTVQLPIGWKKEPTPHSMWSNLLDGQGRARARIFYKAAFYDRRAEIQPVRRYSYGSRPLNGWDAPTEDRDPYIGIVTDQEQVIWRTERELARPASDWDREQVLAFYRGKEGLVAEAKEWLEGNYPDYNDPLAYWDD